MTGYTTPYIARFCREGKILGSQVEGSWQVELNSLLAFFREHQKEKKENRLLLAAKRRDELKPKVLNEKAKEKVREEAREEAKEEVRENPEDSPLESVLLFMVQEQKRIRQDNKQILEELRKQQPVIIQQPKNHRALIIPFVIAATVFGAIILSVSLPYQNAIHGITKNVASSVNSFFEDEIIFEAAENPYMNSPIEDLPASQ